MNTEYSQESLNAMRHTAAHLLAKAVLELWPGAHNAIGPSIENGFYQDFDMGDVTLTDADLPKIEKKMKEILPHWEKFAFSEITLDEANKLFSHNPYKLQLAEEFAAGGKKLLTNDPGNFLDLCKMGHVENPSKELKHVKLLSIAGAYWRGNEKNNMLTRVYGTAFPTKEELDQYLWQIEEARKRDHRKLGKELDLFAFSDLVGPGLALWTPRGTLLRQLVDEYVWNLRYQKGYQRVTIPHITKKELYERSGHWEKFQDDLFKITTREGHEFAMKPMNCPHHTQIYARKPHSYRDLPQKYAETTMCYRDEQTGELHGLSRVRAFTQDDAHVFCRNTQIKEEVLLIWDIINTFYTTLGFDNLRIRLSLHDPLKMQQYLGEEKLWRATEDQLREITRERDKNIVEALGEAAFYGPKLDFMAKDSIGREWQVATIQIDFTQPERFDLTCINEEGEHERIFMIHAAIMGSIERFLSIYMEHCGGAFPLWLSPVQVALLPVSEKYISFAEAFGKKLQSSGIRIEVDSTNESVGKKVRNATSLKVPYIIVMGEQETTSDRISVRVRGKKEALTIDTNTWISHIHGLIQKRSLLLE
ncbi:threonine--tRNA ligase [Candidatus Uhrbacteria bacterium]|nr:threonine--tRNA ligase [Candidatus Uhrbacteria bacterium]